MKFQLNIMQLNSTVPALVFLSFVEDTTYQSLPSCVGIKRLMTQRLPCLINPIDRTLSIPMNTNEELKWIQNYHTHAKNIYLGIVWQTLHCKRLFLASQLLKT